MVAFDGELTGATPSFMRSIISVIREKRSAKTAFPLGSGLLSILHILLPFMQFSLLDSFHGYFALIR